MSKLRNRWTCIGFGTHNYRPVDNHIACLAHKTRSDKPGMSAKSVTKEITPVILPVATDAELSAPETTRRSAKHKRASRKAIACENLVKARAALALSRQAPVVEAKVVKLTKAQTKAAQVRATQLANLAKGRAIMLANRAAREAAQVTVLGDDTAAGAAVAAIELRQTRKQRSAANKAAWAKQRQAQINARKAAATKKAAKPAKVAITAQASREAAKAEAKVIREIAKPRQIRANSLPIEPKAKPAAKAAPVSKPSLRELHANLLGR